jgi:integrase
MNMKPRARGNGQGSLFKRTPTGCWIASYFDHNRKRRTASTGTTDKAAASRILAKLVNESALVKSGVVSRDLADAVEHGARPLPEHVRAFVDGLRAAGRSCQHIDESHTILEVVTKGLAKLSDLTPAMLNRHLLSQRAKKRSARTLQKHLKAVRQFARWCVATGRLHADFTATVSTEAVETDRRLKRRTLTADECNRLIAAASAGPVRFGMAGVDRALLYRVAIATGLRQGEIRSLTRSSIVVERDGAFILVNAGATKNGKTARQHIDTSLADLLAHHAGGKMPGAALFNLPHRTDVADMLRQDLGDARAKWLAEAGDNAAERIARESSDFLAGINHAGERADFHALRVTCGSLLIAQGVDTRTVQSILRHSDPKLTMNTYGRSMPQAAAHAADTLGQLLTPAVAVIATGTDAAIAGAIKVPVAARSSSDSSSHANSNNSVRLGAANVWGKPATNTNENTRKNPGVSRESVGFTTSEGDGARTRNHRIDSPVL